MLMSATTNEDVQRLQRLVLHNPTVIDCTEHGADATDMAGSNATGSSLHIQHYSIQCDRLAAPCCLLVPSCQVQTCFGLITDQESPQD